MDTIAIEGLRVETVIGVYAWEREITQAVTLELELERDLAAAAASDDLTEALDYGAVAAEVARFCRESRFHLIEALAEGIARRVLERFAVETVRLRLSKPVKVAEAGNFNAIIKLERRREA